MQGIEEQAGPCHAGRDTTEQREASTVLEPEKGLEPLACSLRVGSDCALCAPAPHLPYCTVSHERKTHSYRLCVEGPPRCWSTRGRGRDPKEVPPCETLRH